MPESSLQDLLLPALRGEGVPDVEARLLAADPSGSEATLLHLARIAAVEAAAVEHPVDRLLSWAQGADDATSEVLVGRSGLLAEQLEAALEASGASHGLRLAAAGGDEGEDVWPAVYRGGPWEVLIGLDEADRLFVAALAAPSDQGAATVLMAGMAPVDVSVDGDAAVLGPAEGVLGGPAEFNPWAQIAVRSPDGAVESLWLVAP